MNGIGLWTMWKVWQLAHIQGDDHKYVINSNFDKHLFSNKRWQEMWNSSFFKFSIQMFFYSLIKTKKLVQFDTRNMF
jgi:hypothetical protein